MATTQIKLSNSDSLLFETFTRRTDKNGKFIERERAGKYALCASGLVHTSEGTSALWRFLFTQGFVTKGHRSPFGHPYNYSLSDHGREHLAPIIAERNAELGL